MIKASELRIGNYVDTLTGGEIHIPLNCYSKVVKIAIFEAEIIDFDKNPASVEKYDKIELRKLCGIPLTEEWLIKFGFNKTTPGYWSDGKLEIGYTTTDECIEYEYLSVSSDNIASTEMCDLMYCHQLQNLYFALTNEELTSQHPTTISSKT